MRADELATVLYAVWESPGGSSTWESWARGLDAASSTRTSAARSMPDLELLEERLLSSVARRMERLCVPSRALAPASARVVSQPELLVA